MRAAFILLLCATAQAADEPGRDPTAWPPALRSAMAAASAASAASGVEAVTDNAIRQVVFAGGRAYVVQRGRRYGVGEQLEGARIERITEQAVWLREAGQLRREPLYAGVEKRQPQEAPAAASGIKKSKEKP
ncbi:hypothetical protein J2X20_000135 [Pelomonas saccharophila]|uniref:MSHA biogenesis protein MshK n=1 Tax=Roseateles saccharophilus TaxID=304 RepID=A0ABU1YHJ7_ROSSA|nr:hypothetical protein [Roseateles saccharophilus]MDR7267506.1 hypothetical protein [Roseateles saccharophilus]